MKRAIVLGAVVLAVLEGGRSTSAQGTPNLGNFAYYSIQPTVSTVKPGETITLTIRTCGPDSRPPAPPAPTNDDDLTPLPKLDGKPADPDADLVPLPNLCHVGPDVKASSVTATAGKVTQTGPTTLQFTAPGNRNINPVTITATYLNVNGTKASVRLIAKVILDVVQTYQGSTTYTYRQGSTSNTYSAKVTWQFQGEAGGMKMYAPSGTLTATLRDKDCQGSGTVPIQSGQLLFLPGANTTYQFLVNGKDGLSLKCQDGRTLKTPPLSVGLTCTNHDNGQQALVDLTHLSGSCRTGTAAQTWSFVAVK